MKNKCQVTGGFCKGINKLSLLFLLGWFLIACSGGVPQNDSGSSNSPPAPQRITAETAHRMMQESGDFILLDVRTPAEFRRQHIAGAILIPHIEIERRAPLELPDKNAAIFLYCRTGVRSANAARTLAELGYTKVFDFGGIVHWTFGTVTGD